MCVCAATCRQSLTRCSEGRSLRTGSTRRWDAGVLPALMPAGSLVSTGLAASCFSAAFGSPPASCQ